MVFDQCNFWYVWCSWQVLKYDNIIEVGSGWSRRGSLAILESNLDSVAPRCCEGCCFLFIVQHLQDRSCTWYVPNANSSHSGQLCTFSVFWVSASITFSLESIILVLETSLIHQEVGTYRLQSGEKIGPAQFWLCKIQLFPLKQTFVKILDCLELEEKSS